MKDQETAAAADSYTAQLQTAKEMRRLLHDMNNALEIIIQASYLVGTLPLGDDGKEWLKLLDQGVHQATTINLQLRDVIRKNVDDALHA
jgi:hypothetical protein